MPTPTKMPSNLVFKESWRDLMRPLRWHWRCCVMPWRWWFSERTHGNTELMVITFSPCVKFVASRKGSIISTSSLIHVDSLKLPRGLAHRWLSLVSGSSPACAYKGCMLLFTPNFFSKASLKVQLVYSRLLSLEDFDIARPIVFVSLTFLLLRHFS